MRRRQPWREGAGRRVPLRPCQTELRGGSGRGGALRPGNIASSIRAARRVEREITVGKRRSAKRSVKGDEQSAIRGHFAQRGADGFFGQQSMSCDIARLNEAVACEGAAIDAGPVTRPTSKQIAMTKRIITFDDTPHNRTVGDTGQFE